MSKWNTTIHINTGTTIIQTEAMGIKRGIFQGDSLSALWFCLCLNPLSNVLNNTNYGFQIKHQKSTTHTINHLLYMDDIKIYAATKTQMKGLLKIVEDVTSDVKLEFGLTKCKMLVVERGKWSDEILTETLNGQTLDNLRDGETYKYLGLQQNTRIEHTKVKELLKNQYKNRLTLVLNTKLNSKNLFKAINSFVIPTLTYSFGIIKWSKTDIDNINTITSTQLTKHRKHHPNACKERLTIDRVKGEEVCWTFTRYTQIR